MIIAIGSDHAGYQLKETLKKHLIASGHEVIDMGTKSELSVDYPIFGAAVGRAVSNKQADFGVVVCANGEGICMAANKIKGVRCGIAYEDSAAINMRAHNAANVISFGGKTMAAEDCIRRLDLFLSTEPLGDRHARRVNELNALDGSR